jgi:prepilin-type N-terminal cleavage/methylation domain-containing protein
MEVIMNIVNNKILKNRKGFTLVEVIVVLVILAVLAAIAIPALTGYIDKANERKILNDARYGLMALQTMAAEDYAEGTFGITYNYGVGNLGYADAGQGLLELMPEGSIYFNQINSDIDFATLSNGDPSMFHGFANQEGKIIAFLYVDDDGKGFTYNYDLDLNAGTVTYDESAGYRVIPEEE